MVLDVTVSHDLGKSKSSTPSIPKTVTMALSLTLNIKHLYISLPTVFIYFTCLYVISFLPLYSLFANLNALCLH